MNTSRAVSPGEGGPAAGRLALVLSPLGRVRLDTLAGLATDLRGRLRGDISVGPMLALPDARHPRRRQYLASALLAQVRAHLPETGLALGVTDVDLYANRLAFVFGQAELGGRAGVISLARLDPAWCGQPPSCALLRQRALTEAMHELGHMLGAEHCRSPHCVMFFSHDLPDTDRKGADPCPRCRRYYPLR